MRLGDEVAQQGSHPWRLFNLFAALLAVLLVGSSFLSTAAIAQVDPDEVECDEEDPDADVEGCLEQHGDNEAEAENDFEGTGGDGVAGSNVIGAAGSGDTEITANNNSRFADAEGGDVTANSQQVIDNGPDLTVEGGEVNVTAIATGVSTVSQVATPNVEITLNQVASSTGAPTVSNTVNSLTTLTGTNFLGTAIVSPTAVGGGLVTPTATGAGPVTQTLTQTANAPITNVFAPVITTTAANTANLTGSAPVVQTGNATANPTATATAAPNEIRARLIQLGDNDLEVEFNAAGVGGDGVAGSNVIGVAGAGSSVINATNNSEFAEGEGGDVEFDSFVDADNGPDLVVEGGDTNVLAQAIGIATVSQTAAPNLILTGEQTAISTGPSIVSNTLTNTTNITGANIVSQTFSGASFVTGTGAGTVTPTFGAINQILNQTGGGPVTNTFAPVINTNATNVANVTGSTPVTQNATAITNPTATATAGPNEVRGALIQAGDNDLEVEVDGEGVGGDGVAGSNVIGVAGSGDTIIDATNDSMFSDAVGGSVVFEQETLADNGPEVSITGGDVNVTAIATGIANVVQTATPNLIIGLTQSATATNATGLTNSVSNSSTITGSNTIIQTGAGLVTPTGTTLFGPVNQTLTQTGGGAVNNTFAPNATTQTNNTATLSGSSGVNQTATTISNPTAVATAP